MQALARGSASGTLEPAQTHACFFPAPHSVSSLKLAMVGAVYNTEMSELHESGFWGFFPPPGGPVTSTSLGSTCNSTQQTAVESLTFSEHKTQ